MLRRLLIALPLILIVSLACWYYFPKWGVELPWFVPIAGYVVIVGGVITSTLADRAPAREPSREEQILSQDPGPSPEDIRRFGDPWKLPDRDD